MPGEYYTHASDCHSYYVCLENGTLIQEWCPLGEVFDIHNKTCMLAVPGYDCDYRCITPAPTTPVAPDGCNLPPYCDQFQRYPYPDNCTKYYRCYYGHWEMVDCPINEEYDMYDERCTSLARCHPPCYEYTGPTTMGTTPQPIEPGKIILTQLTIAICVPDIMSRATIE